MKASFQEKALEGFSGGPLVKDSLSRPVVVGTKRLMKTPTMIPSSFDKAVVWFSTALLLLGSLSVQAQIGKDWVNRSDGLVSNSRSALAYSGSLYVAASASEDFQNVGKVETSTNGDVWTVASTGLGDTPQSIVWNGSQFLAVTNAQLATSTNANGSAWTVTNPFLSDSMRGLAPSGLNVVAVGGSFTSSGFGPVIYLSTNSGATWSQQTLPSTTTARGLNAVTYTGSQWVAVGDNGTIYTSLNGTTWLRRNVVAAANTFFYSVTQNSSLIVAVGIGYNSSGSSSAEIWTSPTGIAWTRRTVPGLYGVTSVVWTGSNFVAVTEGGTALTSPDGITWKTQDTGITQALKSIAWDGTQVLAVGTSGLVLSSDLLPTVSVGTEESKVLESDGTAKVTIYLSKPATQALSIPLVVTGTATAGSDYTAPSPVSFAIGESAKIVEIDLTDDSTVEGTFDNEEQMIVTLGAAAGVHVKAPKAQTITIIDGDGPPLVNFSVVTNSDNIVAESVGTVSVGIELSWPITTEVTIPLTITGSATSPSDYTGLPTSVIFNPRETLKTISMTIVNDETEEPSDEDITIEMGALPSSVQSGIGNRVSYTVKINDDDPATKIGRRWTLNQPRPSSPDLRGMTRTPTGNVVLVNGGGKALVSTDQGATWSEKHTGSDKPVNDVAFGTGVLIGISENDGSIILSGDSGNTWIKREIPESFSANWTNIVFNGTEFLAVGEDNSGRPVFIASADGIRWEKRSVPNSARGRPSGLVSMGGTKWAAVGTYFNYDSSTQVFSRTPLILTSEDGKIWTDRSSAIASAVLTDVLWTGSSLVAFDNASKNAYTSTDGVAWTARPMSSNGPAETGVWANSRIIAIGSGNVFTSNSAAGFPWTQRATPSLGYIREILWTGTTYVASGFQSIFTSTDGVAWVSRGSSSLYGSLTSAAWSGSQYVAVNREAPYAYTSPDGTTWTERKLPSNRDSRGLESVAWSGSSFVGVGPRGVIMTSANGSTWSTKTQPGGTLDLKQVIWAGNQFVAVGGQDQYDWQSVGPAGSLVLTSPDGNVWTRRTIRTVTPLEGIAWNGRLFVAVGRDGLIMTSSDAATWSAPISSAANGPIPARERHLYAIAWSGFKWIAVGEYRNIWLSDDAVSWTTTNNVPQTSGGDYGSDFLNDILWTGDEFICATGMGTVLHSLDGFAWNERVTKTTRPLNGLVLGNTLLALGDQGTVLTSGSLSVTPAEIFFDAASSTVPETDKVVANVLVRLSKAAATAVTVPLNTTASSGMTLTGLLADVTLTTPLQVVFRPGELAKFVPITIRGDFRAEGPETLTLSFGTLPSTVTAGTTATHEITLQDNDEALIIANQPEDRLLAVGSSLTLSVTLTAGSGPVTYQWTKDGKIIPRATSALFYLNAVQISDGGSYACNIMNPVGSQPSTAARVGVYEVANRAVYVDAAKTPVEATVIQAASSNCAVEWFKDGSSTPVASSGAFLLSNSNRSLKISSLDSNSGEYICKVGLPTSSISVTPSGATWNVGTASGKPELPTITFAAANIGVSYQSTPFSATNGTKVTTWAATGLPLGLRLVDLGNHQFQITGLPSVVGTRQVTITATNGKGPTSVTAPLQVNALPAGLIGTSIGLIDREATVNNLFGGRMQFTFAGTGVFSGSYIVGGTTQSFTGQITASTATTATASATFLSGINTVTISLDYDSTRPGASGLGTITLSRPSAVGFQGATSHFKTWTRHLTPAAYAGRYHFAIMHPSTAAADLSLPQGAGYGIATVTAAGVTTFTGKLGDGSALTGSSVINADGTTIAHSVINKDRGSFMAIPKITLGGTAPAYATSTVEDFTDASWGRLQSLLPTREYAAGWFPSALEISGGKYLAPASGQIVMDLPDVQFTGNAEISFTQAGIDSGSAVGAVVEIEANGSAYAYNSFQYPTDYFTKLRITPATGVFSGTLDLSDSVNAILIKRSPIAYDGLIIPSFKSSSSATGEYQGVGQFKLPLLPDANTSPMPAAASTPILTGRVKLIKLP
jgi:photosystem II stability/assembly factor-like uncharacterized protein